MTTMDVETRVLPASQCQIRATQEGDAKRLSGYGIVFGSLSQDLGGFREQIDKAAAKRTLSLENDFLVTMNHNVDGLLGRTGADTARVGSDEIGVWYDVLVPDTQPGRDAWTLADRGDLRGSSFTFSVPKDGDRWDTDEDGRRIRTVTELRLIELGPVASPAYLDTTVAARSLASLIEQESNSADGADGDTRDTPTVSVIARRLRTVR